MNAGRGLRVFGSRVATDSGFSHLRQPRVSKPYTSARQHFPRQHGFSRCLPRVLHASSHGTGHSFSGAANGWRDWAGEESQEEAYATKNQEDQAPDGRYTRECGYRSSGRYEHARFETAAGFPYALNAQSWEFNLKLTSFRSDGNEEQSLKTAGVDEIGDGLMSATDVKSKSTSEAGLHQETTAAKQREGLEPVQSLPEPQKPNVLSFPYYPNLQSIYGPTTPSFYQHPLWNGQHPIAAGPLPVRQQHYQLPRLSKHPKNRGFASNGPSTNPGRLHREEMQYTLPVPIPSSTYMAQAAADPIHDSKLRRLLVVLDLNGTLLFRKHSQTFIRRPNVDNFLSYLFANHKVMVWSSARPANVHGICQRLLSKDQQESLVAIWGRDTLRLSTKDYAKRVQVYKQLSWIWTDPAIQASSREVSEKQPDGEEWSQANTILIDDSSEKARSEPHNLVRIDEFLGRDDQMKVDVLGQVVQYLEWARKHEDVSACVRAHPWYFNPNVDTSPSFGMK